MVAMARALMSRPRMIVMDEPTMGLSPLYVDRVLELIRTINQEGVSVFMVEQNASLALEIAHEAYVLQTGKIVLVRLGADAEGRSPRARRLSRRVRGGVRRACTKIVPVARDCTGPYDHSMKRSYR